MESIISYAGLDENALWSQATRLFAHNDDLPERFRLFIPLFPMELVVDMPYQGGQFVCDEAAYHRVLSERLPMLYKGENLRRCFDRDGAFCGGPVTVDRAWAAAFPQYQPFTGDRLYVYMIGGGHQAAAVPESIFPRCANLLPGAERELGIAERCRQVSAWLADRLEGGDSYDADHLEEVYLTQQRLRPVAIRQKELARVMQEVRIVRQLHGGHPAPLAEAGAVRQYVPFRYACDCFEPAPVTRASARLIQLYFDGDSGVGDLWLPYEAASEYIDKRKMVIDMRALCEGFQIAPACDADTRGGVYPDRVRVAVVRDRTLPMLVAETVNNPAYGSGMNPQGRLSQLICLPGSAELLRKGQLGEEAHAFTCKNTHVDEAEYLHMRALAEWQEHKGRLIDALYRRESALNQTAPNSRAYERIRDLLDSRVDRLWRIAANEPSPHGPRSGYDADIDYLRRKADARMQGSAFEPDPQREKQIETGYAMRSLPRSYPLTDLCPKPERSAARPARSGRQQAADGQWFEQVSMFEE